MAIASNISKTPIAIKIIHKIFDKPNSFSGRFPVTVVVLGELVLEEVFVVVLELLVVLLIVFTILILI